MISWKNPPLDIFLYVSPLSPPLSPNTLTLQICPSFAIVVTTSVIPPWKTAAAEQEASVRQRQEGLEVWMKGGRNADRQVG